MDKHYKYDDRGFIKYTAIHKNGTKYDDYGFDKFGYNANGFKRNGYHKNGTKYNECGYDIKGAKKKTAINGRYDDRGFIKYTAIHKNGTKYDDYGFDKFGYNADGFKWNGYHKNGTKYDEFGYDIKGVNKYGEQKETGINHIISEVREVHSNNIGGRTIDTNSLQEFMCRTLERNKEKYKIYTKLQIAKSLAQEVDDYFTKNKINYKFINKSGLETAIYDFITNTKSYDLENKEDDEIKQYNFQNTTQANNLNLEDELSKIIGLEEVKNIIRDQYKMLLAQQKRKKAGVIVRNEQTLNMIFLGNPGTGKTTIARIIANMFQKMGVIKYNKLVEVDRSELVGQYIGHTAIKTKEKFMEALGGVLLIDEAYTLSRGNENDFGKEAIDTLVKLIEDYRNEIVVILTGYSKEMLEFIESNSGLKSRFTFKIYFNDYTEVELYKIALRMIEDRGFILNSDAIDVLREEIIMMKKKSDRTSGNGRMIRNYIEQVIKNQSVRIVSEEVSKQGLNMIIKEDIKILKSNINRFELEEELEKIIGLNKVKDYIRTLSARIRIQKQREKFDLPNNGAELLNMIFLGNPGTGKTMVARLISKLLYRIGAIASDKLIETSRSELVGKYIGHTAIKTRKKVMEAIDGVLFIDEAYSLFKSNDDRDFGKEAVDELTKLVDDYSERLVVIMAGYGDEMNYLISSNSGLKSRFPNVIEFNDYCIDELMKICINIFEENQYNLTSNAKKKLREIFIEAKKVEYFGNGRYVRNLYESIINNQSIRLNSKIEINKEDLVLILDEDIKRI